MNNNTKPILSAADRATLPLATPAPAIALIRPQMGENIGAAARAMANFGLEELYIVNPRDGWPNEKAFALCAGATWPLDNAKICPNTNDALQEKTIVFATSGTPRQLDKPLISPQQAIKIINAAMKDGQKPIVLFGSERTGLDQIDLISADYIITYPTDSRFPSLNLAQSIAVFCYLWAVRDNEAIPDDWNIKHGELAPRKFFDSMFDFFTQELDTIGFFWPADRRENMIESLRNSLIRAKFSESEINLFRGALRAIHEGPRRRFAQLQRQENNEKIKIYIKENFEQAIILDILIEAERAIAIIAQNGQTLTLKFSNLNDKIICDSFNQRPFE